MGRTQREGVLERASDDEVTEPVVPPPDTDVATPRATPLRVVLAALLGCYGPMAAVWPHGVENVNGALILLAFAVGWVILLRPSWATLWRAPAVLLALAVALVTIPTIGRTPVMVAFVGVVVSSAAIVGWRPLPAWPTRPVPTVVPAVILVAAAQRVWLSSQDVPGAVLVLGAALVVVEIYHRVGWAGDADLAVRRRLRTAPGIGPAWAFLVETARDLRRAARRIGRDVMAWVRGPKDAREVSYAMALVVGLLVRWYWVDRMTQPDETWYTKWNFDIARQAAEGRTPTFSGVKTAYWPPGYGFTLAPLAWLERWTDLVDLHRSATFLNVVLGMITVVLAGVLATQWLSARARNPAVWLMALAPGQVFVASAAVAETLTTALVLGVVVAMSAVVQRRHGAARTRGLVLVGLLLGYGVLVRDVAFLLVALLPLVVRVTDGAWRPAFKALLPLLAGMAVLLVAWGVRNAVQVDHYSPFSTTGAEGVCFTQKDVDLLQYNARFDAEGYARAVGPKDFEDCYRGSPFDTRRLDIDFYTPPGFFEFREPHEGEWARRQNGRFVSWAVTHPWHIIETVPVRLYDGLGNDDHGGYDIATEYKTIALTGPYAAKVLEQAGQAWYYFVAGLTLLALFRVREVRRAPALWFPPVIYATYTFAAPWSLSRHVYPCYPFLAVMAAGAIALVSSRTERQEPADDPEPSLVTAASAGP